MVRDVVVCDGVVRDVVVRDFMVRDIVVRDIAGCYAQWPPGKTRFLHMLYHLLQQMYVPTLSHSVSTRVGQ